MSGSVTDADSVVFDRQAVLDMVDGEVDFVCELINMFLTDLPPQLDAVRAAMSAQSSEGVYKTCHRLKTSVGNLGGNKARVFVVELEQHARAGQLENSQHLFNACLHELNAFQAELRAFLANPES